ncbi:MAG TPA: DUF1223 domain-containing protein [Bryobacteraceae bacterium]|nr:DUF1223 domain-containing protein [Bryobacteraceae bacterium]
MVRQIFTLSAATVLLAFACGAATRTPVVLELFTSEGCSSCPPADQLIADLDKTQPIAGVDVIVLSEHVDYWNRLGWSDPFSSEVFSARQQQYAKALHVEDVYTPQAVVDGQLEAVGSNAAKLTQAVAKAARQTKVPLELAATRSDGKIEARVRWDGAEKLHDSVVVYLALAQNDTQSQVRAGENSGRMLKHVAVVRRIAEVGTLKANTPFSKETTLPYNSEWGSSGLRVIAFLQEKTSGRIIGAVQRKL